MPSLSTWSLDASRIWYKSFSNLFRFLHHKITHWETFPNVLLSSFLKYLKRSALEKCIYFFVRLFLVTFSDSFFPVSTPRFFYFEKQQSILRLRFFSLTIRKRTEFAETYSIFTCFFDFRLIFKMKVQAVFQQKLLPKSYKLQHRNQTIN